MQIVLMRHGKAENSQMGQRDHDRALATRGMLNAADQAREFRPATGDGMIVSDALRTRQTADALFSAWSDLGEADLPNRRDTPQGYLAPANQWLDLIAMETTSKRLWIIGHNPGISAGHGADGRLHWHGNRRHRDDRPRHRPVVRHPTGIRVNRAPPPRTRRVTSPHVQRCSRI
jgi:phosphohistidine phosphatase SixA